MVIKETTEDEVDAPPPGRNVGECIEDNQDILDCYRAEIHRLESFRDWPDWALANPETLAKNGFFFLGDFDRVQCAFCLVILKNWEETDIVEDEHRKYSPQCPFLIGIVKGNIPFCRSPDDISKNASFPEYSRMEKRIESYKNWPRALKQRPQELAAAGFYYTGHGDNVQCFMCGGMLRNWNEPDEPWLEHKLWFPLCPFVLENDPRDEKEPIHNEIRKNLKRSLSNGAIEKGYAGDLIKIYKDYKKINGIPESEDLDHFIEELDQFKIQSDTQPHSVTFSSIPQEGAAASNYVHRPSSIPQSTGEEKPSDEDRCQCIICMAHEREITFLPCNHFVTCQQCSHIVHECPVCRARIRGTQRTYLH